MGFGYPYRVKYHGYMIDYSERSVPDESEAEKERRSFELCLRRMQEEEFKKEMEELNEGVVF